MKSGNNNIIYLIRSLRGLNEEMQLKRLAEDVTQSERQGVGAAETRCFCCPCHCVVASWLLSTFLLITPSFKWKLLPGRDPVARRESPSASQLALSAPPGRIVRLM